MIVIELFDGACEKILSAYCRVHKWNVRNCLALVANRVHFDSGELIQDEQADK